MHAAKSDSEAKKNPILAAPEIPICFFLGKWFSGSRMQNSISKQAWCKKLFRIVNDLFISVGTAFRHSYGLAFVDNFLSKVSSSSRSLLKMHAVFEICQFLPCKNLGHVTTSKKQIWGGSVSLDLPNTYLIFLHLLCLWVANDATISKRILFDHFRLFFFWNSHLLQWNCDFFFLQYEIYLKINYFFPLAVCRIRLDRNKKNFLL